MDTFSPEEAGIALARAGISAAEAEPLLRMVFSDDEDISATPEPDYSLSDALYAYACERIHTALHEYGRRVSRKVHNDSVDIGALSK